MALAAEMLKAEARPDTGYAAHVVSRWSEARGRFEAGLKAGSATPFQSLAVLDAWYGALAARPEIEPVLVSVGESDTGVDVLHLPLVRRRVGLARVITFADLDLIDYNAPIVAGSAPITREAARRMWRAVQSALPAADLIDLRKMPPVVGGIPNPLALLSTLASSLNGNVVRIEGTFDEYARGTLRRVVRKELERSWRVFTRHPEVTFGPVLGAAERRRVLGVIEAQQPLRMEMTGKDYRLDESHAADFYRRLVDGDAAGERVVLLALKAGSEVVAALLGLREGDGFIMIRISSSTASDWTNCSPGRLVIARAMEFLRSDGVRAFDFSVGNYDYKRRFGVGPLPLVDLVRPLTPLGLPAAASLYGRAWLRRHPAIEDRVRGWLGRRRPQEHAP